MTTATWQWVDARQLDYQAYLSWGWSPMDAAWSAYYGKPFQALLVRDGEVSGGCVGSPDS